MSKVKYVLYILDVKVLLNEQHEINEENPNWVMYSTKKQGNLLRKPFAISFLTIFSF
jgi:hypothetical protein